MTETAYTSVIFIKPGLSATLTYTFTACDAATVPKRATRWEARTPHEITVTEHAGQDFTDELIPYYIRWTDDNPVDSAQISLY